MTTPGSTDNQYVSLIHDLLTVGEPVVTRNSTVLRLSDPRVLTFYYTPLVTVRKTAWKNALREWEWFMSGSSNIKDLHPSVHPWWKPWADKDGVVRNNYSKQFRHFNGRFDQIQHIIEAVRDHPFSRRSVMTTWNPEDMAASETPVTNCHGTVTQFFVSGNQLNMVTYQRSADVICGLPANWIQSWAFIQWLAHRTGRKPGFLSWIGGDMHLYDAHLALAQEMVRAGEANRSPNLVYKPSSEEFLADDFSLDRPYEPVLTTRAEMIV